MTADELFEHEMRGRIRRELRTIEVVDQNPSPTRRLQVKADSWKSVGIYQRQVNDKTSSASFSKSAEFELQLAAALTPPGQMAWCTSLERLLLMSSDEGWARAQAAASEPIPEDDQKFQHPNRVGSTLDRRYYYLSLKDLMLSGQSLDYGAKASAVELKKAWYPGLGDAIIGLSKGDPKQFVSGLEHMLTKHHNKAKSKSSWLYGLADRYYCCPAAALLQIAKRTKGWDLGAQVKGRRQKLHIDAVWCRDHLKEMPNAVLEGTLEVDYLKGS